MGMSELKGITSADLFQYTIRKCAFNHLLRHVGHCDLNRHIDLQTQLTIKNTNKRYLGIDSRLLFGTLIIRR